MADLKVINVGSVAGKSELFQPAPLEFSSLGRTVKVFLQAVEEAVTIAIKKTAQGFVLYDVSVADATGVNFITDADHVFDSALKAGANLVYKWFENGTALTDGAGNDIELTIEGFVNYQSESLPDDNFLIVDQINNKVLVYNPADIQGVISGMSEIVSFNQVSSNIWE